MLKCANGEHCTLMERLLAEGQGENRRGFSGVTTINLKDGNMRYIGVRYCATSKRTDKGVMLNFCPMCGEPIQWWERK